MSAEIVIEGSTVEEGVIEAMICAHCEETLAETDAYQCLTCNSSNESGLKAYHCEQCLVVLHLKKNHNIRDFKGYEPEVCANHRKLCLLFCDDCQILFCDKCLGPHCQHKFRPSSEKASDVRKSIFEFLTKFEELAKPVKRREFIEKETCDERDKIAKSLDSLNFETTLASMVTKVIYDNADRLFQLMPRKNGDVTQRSDLICSISQRNDTQVTNLRDLLRSSDGACIKQFLNNVKSVECSVTEQTECLKSHIYLQWNRKWEDIILDSLSNAVKLMSVPQTETKLYKQLSLAPKMHFATPKEISLPTLNKLCIFHCFNVKLNDDRVEFIFYHRMNVSEVFLTGVEFEFIDSARRFVFVKKKDATEEANFIIDLTRKIMRRVCREKDYFQTIDERGWKIIGFNQCSCPFYCYLDVYVWSESQHAVANNQFGREPNFLMKEVYAEPKFFYQYFDVYVCVDKDDKIIMQHIKNGTRIEVVRNEHQLSQIDRVGIECEKDGVVPVLLMDFKDRVAMRCRANFANVTSLKWEVLDIFKLDIPSSDATLRFFYNYDWRKLLVYDQETIYEANLEVK